MAQSFLKTLPLGPSYEGTCSYVGSMCSRHPLEPGAINCKCTKPEPLVETACMAREDFESAPWAGSRQTWAASCKTEAASSGNRPAVQVNHNVGTHDLHQNDVLRHNE